MGGCGSVQVHPESLGQRTPVGEEMSRRESARAAFSLLDKDGDNKVTADEIREAMVLAGMDTPTREELIQIMQRVDTDGDGSVDVFEFSDVKALRLQHIGQGLLEIERAKRAAQEAMGLRRSDATDLSRASSMTSSRTSNTPSRHRPRRRTRDVYAPEVA